jgi:UDP-2,3-diacylglucosamine hydrolase
LPDAAGAAQVDLPPSVRAVDFISDLHLSADLPLTMAAFKCYLQGTHADALFILGDLFEAWVGDDMASQDFEAQCVRELADAARRMPVYVMHGNRDFLLGERFFHASRTTSLADPCQVCAFGGQRLLLSHGDALCLADTAYQQFRAQVRAPAWAEEFLARPLAERLQIAAQMRAASRAHQQLAAPVTFADADPQLATGWLARAGTQTLVHGHTHRPASEQRPEGWQRHVLSDWDTDHAAPPRAEVLRWTTVGFERLAPAAA